MTPKTLGDFRAEGKTKVAIVGFCSTSRDLTPYEDGSFVIIGLNRGAIFMHRADVWFDMHGMHILDNQERRPGNHMEFLRKFPGPVYVHQRFAELGENQVVYPLKEVADDLGAAVFRIGTADAKGKMTNTDKVRDTRGEPYLSSSIAYEIALAIHEGFEEIHLLGVDLNTESEYLWQRAGVEYLLGVAAGRGIKVFLPDNCPMLKGKLYGRGFMSERGEHFDYEQLAGRLKSLQNEAQAVQTEMAKAEGAKGALDFVTGQMIPGIDHEMVEARLKEVNEIIQKCGRRLLQVQGQLTETVYWLHQTRAGQQPDEAIQQIIDKHSERLSEGPITDVDELEHWEPAVTVAVNTRAVLTGNPETVGFELTPAVAGDTRNGYHAEPDGITG